MSHLKIYITIGYFLLVAATAGSAQIQTIIKEPYRNVQFFTPEHVFYDDGTLVSRYSAYLITCVDGIPLLNVPESINRPHTIQIVPGRYNVEVNIEGEVKKFLVEIDESSFQQYRLFKENNTNDADSLFIFRPKLNKQMFECRK